MERANVFLNGAGPAKHIRPVKPGRRKMSAAGRARIAAAPKAPVGDSKEDEVRPAKRLRRSSWKTMAGALN